MIDEAAVRACLNTIIDPCSEAAGAPAGLADMGLIDSIEIEEAEEGARVRIALCVTHPTCLMAGAFL
ncbi:MAG: iron-sulfur cluster assembly protein, partial [Caulobacterales bacterium]|nr:iron-sulfur cluster assembly protein [Caulobacterales bacterium]